MWVTISKMSGELFGNQPVFSEQYQKNVCDCNADNAEHGVQNGVSPRGDPSEKIHVASFKDLGTLSQALLENFLKEVFKTFKNFNQGDFYPFLFVVQILV